MKEEAAQERLVEQLKKRGGGAASHSDATIGSGGNEGSDGGGSGTVSGNGMDQRDARKVLHLSLYAQRFPSSSPVLSYPLPCPRIPI